MKRMLLRVAGLTVVVCALSVATAQAQSHFSVHVGVGVPVGPVVVAPRVAEHWRRCNPRTDAACGVGSST